MNKRRTNRPLLLAILDGFGLSDRTEGNAISKADTPFLDELFASYPWSRLKASGKAVGLPEGQIGNSEVGHMNLGAGRVVEQPILRINEAIETGEFFENSVLCSCVDRVINSESTLHLYGLLSDGGVHSHEEHVKALIELAVRRELDDVAVHAQLDGRDVPPQSAKQYLENLLACFDRLDRGYLASMSGRYYGMDRDERWDRTKKAYKAMVEGESAVRERDPIEALKDAYEERDELDEFVTPTVFVDEQGEPRTTIQPGDGIICFNFRADRVRQMTRALTDPDFSHFKTPWTVDNYVCMTQYDEDFALPVAFPPLNLDNVLTEYLSREGFNQYHTAETEKYAHVTFFFNGGEEQPFPKEERKLIPSPKVSTYDREPAMSAESITETLVRRLRKEKDDFVLVNYANPDMVGHTGDLEATAQSIEVLDGCLYKLNSVVQELGGELMVTADHGNAEQMIDPETGSTHTAHTLNDCPLIYAGPKNLELENGILADVAPTLLALLNLPVPEEMNGTSLVDRQFSVSS